MLCVMVFFCLCCNSLVSSLNVKCNQKGSMNTKTIATLACFSFDTQSLNGSEPWICRIISWQHNSTALPTGFLSVWSGWPEWVSRWVNGAERRRMLTHLRPSGPMGKAQQTQEPAECEQLFVDTSRHWNSSSLQSRSQLEAAALIFVGHHAVFKERRK